LSLKEPIPNKVVTGGIGLLMVAGLGAFVFAMGVQNSVQALTWTHTVAAAEIGNCGVDQWANDSGGATRCDVSVTFSDHGHQVHAVISDVDPGDVHGTGAIRKLNVYYDPHSPGDVQVDGVPDAWMIGCLVVGAGLMALAVWISVRYFWRRQHRQGAL
jgi:hypothetical protein